MIKEKAGVCRCYFYKEKMKNNDEPLVYCSENVGPGPQG